MGKPKNQDNRVQVTRITGNQDETGLVSRSVDEKMGKMRDHINTFTKSAFTQ